MTVYVADAETAQDLRDNDSFLACTSRRTESELQEVTVTALRACNTTPKRRFDTEAYEKLFQPSDYRPVPVTLRYPGDRTVYLPTHEDALDLLASDDV